MNEEENAYNDWLAKQDKSRDTYNILERLGQVALDYAKAEREIERLRAENADLRARLDAQAKRPGFPQPDNNPKNEWDYINQRWITPDPDEPVAGTA